MRKIQTQFWEFFRFHGLDPKTHNLRPSEEESDEVDGELDEAEDEVDAEGRDTRMQLNMKRKDWLTHSTMSFFSL